MNHSPAFTVFTPTYNRADVLPRVYESLRRQTFRDFEWLIVDDGSADETPDLVARWIAEGDLSIRYVQQEHLGLGTAFNRGVREARGTNFLELDSDDACVPEALERFNHHWDSIPADQADRFCGVTVLCSDADGNVVGDRFPADAFDSDYLEMRYRYKVTGEKWGFQRRDVLARFPFPEPPGQPHMPHGVIWGPIARAGYKTRYVNEALRTYFTDRSDTMSKDRADKVAYSLRFYHQAALTNDLRWFRSRPLLFLKSAIQYARYSFHRRINIIAQAGELKPWGSKALWAIALPVGYVLARRDCR